MNHLHPFRFCLTAFAGLMSSLSLISVSPGFQPSDGPSGTVPLIMDGDPASEMVDGIDRFLLREIAAGAQSRSARFHVDVSSPAAWEKSLAPHREKLAKCLGIRDSRLSYAAPEVISAVGSDTIMFRNQAFTVQAVRWPVLSDPSPQGAGLASIHGEGLLLTPTGRIVASVILIPDADQTPEQWCGLAKNAGSAPSAARRLAESGCRVIVPTLISRHREKRLGRADLTNREYLHRAAFELGRTLAGYEVQMSLSLVDWLSASSPETPIAVFGYGEGGMEALFAAALDTRIQAVAVSGFFGPRDESWKEPIDRNFFGLLRDFGAEELAMLIAPRRLIIETATAPERILEGNGGAPAEIRTPDAQQVADLIRSAASRTPAADFAVVIQPENGQHGDERTLSEILRSIVKHPLVFAATPRQELQAASAADPSGPSVAAAVDRESRLLKQIDRHNQALLRESPFVRREFMSKLDFSSVDAYEESSKAYRETFRKDVIGEFEQPLLPFNARSRQSWDTEKWTGHEVVLDVFPDVFAYGVLLLPKDLKPGEKRPVVVCQHGLEGRPTDTFLNDHYAYHDFAAKLCERGFITFAPQNPYIFTDRFRTLQRKAQPLGKTLFSVIVPQHQQIVNWLKTQPCVDPDRIAFYGLSYGGKSAMRIPALVTDYCLSICSADFNEWVLKNASTRHNFSYIWTGEYEIFEWDLGSTFNYAEMAALICPRPFMVERGHFDGVGEDDWVGYEYAKVRYLYAAQLKIGDRTEIEWFVGPHTINGQATYRFLHRHLDWPIP